jgi:hypothetical protein
VNTRNILALTRALDIFSKSLDYSQVGNPHTCGRKGFTRSLWENERQMPNNRRDSSKGDLEKVKAEMESVLDEKYDGRR